MSSEKSIEEIDRYKVGKILKERSAESDCYFMLAEVIGRRISYICGFYPDYPLTAEKKEILINEKYMLIVQKESGFFSETDISLLTDTGEIIERYIP